jgi:2,3-bisphosphoglycerate-independent phosphoglycerate mutase
VDGLGVGPDEPGTNPIARATLPTLHALLGGKLPLEGRLGGRSEGAALIRPIDANLGVPGRPQSGTGQTALLTGINASRALGRHFGPWVPTDLRELLARENLFGRALGLGRTVEFANAYPEGHFGGRTGRVRPGAFPFAARSAGVLRRHEASLHAGDAVVSSIDTARWRQHVDPAAPDPSPAEAGETLARIASRADLTVFAHYDTDLAGHHRDLAAGVAAVELLDAFLAGLLPALPAGTLLLLVSDHGNLEDVRVGHTRNPVPLIATGPGADQVIARARAITDVAPCILGLLGDPGR